ASWVVPPGSFERAEDAATGRTVVVAGTYEPVDRAPVGFFDAMVALPRGMADSADVIFLIFLIGGAFTVVDETGTLRRGVAWLVRRLHGRDLLVVPVVSALFATGGALQNMQEEIIALIPVLLILTRRMGFTPLVAVSMSAGAAFVGSAFSPINPFQVGIAQRLAEVPLLSGWAFRSSFLALALLFWVAVTMRHAARTRVAPRTDDVVEEAPMGAGDWGVLAFVGLTFATLVWGLLAQGWDFDHMSALFFIMGTVVGLVAGLGVTGTADAYVKGFRDMAYAALLVGFARAIFVVLQDGRIVDTLVHALFTPLEGLPMLASAFGMVVAQAAIHVPVPSVSGQAVLTMPVLVPLSDLLGMSRQITILAYQYGGGLCDLVTPTNGALMAILATAGVRYDEWIRFAGPLWLGLVALGAASIALGIAIGF
ncbi:MAG TPA: hypothetical protein VLA43_00785, partial [Longimicrobiales bacterium]|nr:hypothetical protein [Longimicrobiales bacterium]